MSPVSIERKVNKILLQYIIDILKSKLERNMSGSLLIRSQECSFLSSHPISSYFHSSFGRRVLGTFSFISCGK